jgi:hypothetical protein
MQMDMQDFKIQVDEIPVSETAAKQLDLFCAALAEMKSSGQSPNSDLIKGGLAALTALLKSEGQAGPASNWTARFTKSPFGSGGGIALENKSTRQHLTVSVDSKGAFYNGTWARYVTDDNVEGALFELKESPEGYVFELMDGAQTKTCLLSSNLEGMAWTSTVEEVLPDWLKESKKKTGMPIPQQGVQTKPSAVPAEPDITAPPEPEKIERKEPPSWEALQAKLEPDDRKTEVSPDLTQDVSTPEDIHSDVCPACAKPVNKKAKFCPACGSKLLTDSATIIINQSFEGQAELLQGSQTDTANKIPVRQVDIPPPQHLCRKCGRPLGPGARFCNHCGTSI